MTSSVKARHRKAARPLTPLSTAGPTARRGFAVAASSGLALTMIASGANAAGDGTDVGESAGALADTGIGTMADGAREAVTTNAAIVVSSEAAGPAEATADAATSEVTTEAAPVEQPAPAVEEAVQTTAPAEETASAAVQAAPAEQYSSSNVESTSNQDAAPAEAPSSSSAGSIAATAMQYIGAPYVYGASGPSSFDCSGLVQYVYGQFGISVPHSSGGIRSAGTVVSAAAAQPGDVIWWSGHVAIYTGDGMMVSADSPGQGVQYRAVDGGGTFLRF